MSTPHRLVRPEGMSPAVGFSHAVVARAGHTIHVAGQIAADATGRMVGSGFPDQFDVALGNVITALTSAGGNSEHVVSMTIYTTDLDGYRASSPELGTVWRKHMGLHYPAMALLGVAGLVEPEAVVEISAIAVIPQA